MPTLHAESINLTPETIRRFLDLGFRVSFPGNMDPEMWEKVRPYRALIEEVYASLHHDVFPSARVLVDPLTPEEHLQQLLSLGQQLTSDNVALNVVLNLQPLPWRVDENLLFDHLDRLLDVADIRISVSDFVWAHRLRNRYANLPIDMSVIAKIDSSFKAMYWSRHIGSNTVTVDRNINKKPHILRQISKAGFKVKLVVSDGCMPSCPAEINHWIAAAASSAEELGPTLFLYRFVLPFHQRTPGTLAHAEKRSSAVSLAPIRRSSRSRKTLRPNGQHRRKPANSRRLRTDGVRHPPAISIQGIGKQYRQTGAMRLELSRLRLVFPAHDTPRYRPTRRLAKSRKKCRFRHHRRPLR